MKRKNLDLTHLILFYLCIVNIYTRCPNDCSGHGSCDSNGRCTCYNQVGLTKDGQGESFTGNDCSLKKCPVGNPFSTVFSKYPSNANNAPTTSQVPEVGDTPERMLDTISTNRTLPASPITVKEVNKDTNLYYVTNFANTLIEGLNEEYGGILKCHYQSDKTDISRRRRRVLTKKNGDIIIADVKRWVNDKNTINSYIQFDVKIHTEAEPTTELSESISITSVVCDKIVNIRTDWSTYNPVAVDGSKVVTWKNYGKIVNELGLFKGKNEVNKYSKVVKMACTSSIDCDSEIKVYDATAEIDPPKEADYIPDDNSNVKFAIDDSSNTLSEGCICFLLGEKVDDISTTNLGINVRVDDSDGNKNNIGKYPIPSSSEIIKTSKGHTVILLNGKEDVISSNAITSSFADLKEYLKINRTVYLSVISNNNIYEVAVRIIGIESSNKYSFTPELPSTTIPLQYIRMFPTNEANYLNEILDETSHLYKLNIQIGFLTSLQSPEVGGLLECNKDGNLILIDVKGYKLDENGFPVYSYVQFNQALSDGELKPETERRLLLIDDFGIGGMKCIGIYIRNDLSYLNPTIPTDNNKKIVWKGYKPILNNMKFKINKSLLSFACLKNDDDANQFIILNATDVQYNNNDITFTLNNEDNVDVFKVCYLLSDVEGNNMNILDTDLGQNVRMNNDKYYLGKYTNSDNNNLDIIADEEKDKVIVMKKKDSDNVIENANIKCNYEGIEDYLLVDRKIYLSILLDNNIIIEQPVIIESITTNTFTFSNAINIIYGSNFLYYIRTFPINKLSPLPPTFLKGDSLANDNKFWVVYYLNTSIQSSSLTDIGAILQCSNGLEADIKGKVENETYAYYILFNKEVNSGSVINIECNKYITKRNDLSLYYSFTVKKQKDEETAITTTTNVAIYSKLLFNMGFFPSEPIEVEEKKKFFQRNVNMSCMNKENDIIIYPNVSVSTLSDLTDKVTLTFPKDYLSLLEDEVSYSCGILSDSKGEVLDILNTDLGVNVRKDNKSDKYIVGKYEQPEKGIKTGNENGHLVIILPKETIKEGTIEILSEDLNSNKKVGLYLLPGQYIFIPIIKAQEIREHTAIIQSVEAQQRQLTDEPKTTITFKPEIPKDWNTLSTIRTSPSDDGIKDNMKDEEIKPSEKQPLQVLDDNINLYIVDKNDSPSLYDISVKLPITGGLLQCQYKSDDNELFKGTVDVKSYSDKEMFIEFKGGIYKENKEAGRSLEEIYNIDNIECDRILSVRNDLSLINPQVVNDLSITWIGYKTIFDSLYSTDNYTISFACYNPNSMNQEINIYNGNITVSSNDNDYIFTFINDDNIKTPKNGEICFLLSDINGNTITIEKSDLFSMIREGKNDHYYFGKYVSVSDTTFHIQYNDDDGSTILTIGRNISGDGNITTNSLLNGYLQLDLSLISNSNSLLSLLIPGTHMSVYELYRNGKRVFIGSVQIMKKTLMTSEDDDDKKKISTIILNLSDKLLVTNVETPTTPEATTPEATTPEATTTADKPDGRRRILDSFPNDVIGYEIEFRTMETTHIPIECSGQGECDRITGQCKCYEGFEGSACQRLSCPNNCNGNGICVPLKEILGNKDLSSYGGYGNANSDSSSSDVFPDLVFGCLCDSGRRGADCSLKECPSGVDPLDSNNRNSEVKRDCSGRGICDYTSGKCECFDGFVGEGCQIMSSMV